MARLALTGMRTLSLQAYVHACGNNGPGGGGGGGGGNQARPGPAQARARTEATAQTMVASAAVAGQRGYEQEHGRVPRNVRWRLRLHHRLSGSG